MRNLTKTLAVVSLLAPASAHSLGIGDIKLHSALNQNLNAEISLVLSAGEKISDIKVNLAPPDKFDEAGVPWTYFLSKIKFEPVVRPNGSVVVKLSSNEALKEPFLGLLLEVSWPKGTAYREFSVLVDPPAVYEQAAIPVASLPESYAPAQAYTTPTEYVSRPQRPQQRSRRNVTVAGKYGPTRRNDTLWKIAENASRQHKVSVEQMMIAIYRGNPGAFQGNVHTLLAGKTLKIPEREAILKLSHKQAIEEFDRQTAAWKNRSAPAPVETAAANRNNVQEETVKNQLTLAAPLEESVADNAVITPGQEQTSTGTKPAASTGAAKQTDQLPADKANETVDGKAPVGEALQNKVAELEKQLALMQQMIALKDQQLAALQNQPRTEMPAVPSQQAVQPAPVVPQQPAQPIPQAQPETVQSTPQSQQQSVQTSPADQQQPVNATETSQPALKPAPAPKPVSHAAAEPEEDTYYQVVGGIGAGILSLLGWFWWRKRKVEEMADTESMFVPSIMVQSEDSEMVTSTAPMIEDSKAYNVDSVGESSFLSEFTPSDFDAFDTDHGEIDPVSEADVYLAYGRYQQAEELMRHAIKDHPDRDECKLKLLEIFYANDNKNAFENYANELAAAGKNTEFDFWQKVKEMGSELCPESSLFSNEENPYVPEDEIETGPAGVINLTKQEEPAPQAANTGNDDMEFDLAAFDEPSFDQPIQEAAKASNDDLDFGLPSFEVEDSVDQGDQRNNASIDFDLNSFAADTVKSENPNNEIKFPGAAEQSEPVESPYAFDSFDFDLSSDNGSGEDDSEIDLVATGKTGIDSSLDQSQNHQHAFAGDINFDFDLSALEDEQDFDQNERQGVSDLTDMDELETKLDLARAYIDMGDSDSAREIALEVFEKGSAEQKKMAQTMLNDLA